MKISKKIEKKIKKLKNLFPELFLAKTTVDRPRNRGKKNFAPIFVHTRPGEDNSEKNSKKIQKIKKPHSGSISSQNGMRYAEKERKKFYSRILFRPNPSFKIPNKK